MKHWRATFDDREHDRTWTETFEAPGATEALHHAGQMTVSPEMIEEHGEHVTVLSVELNQQFLGPYRYNIPPFSRIPKGEEVRSENPCGICGRHVDVILYYGIITREMTWGLKDEDGDRWVIDIPCHRKYRLVK